MKIVARRTLLRIRIGTSSRQNRTGLRTSGLRTFGLRTSAARISATPHAFAPPLLARAHVWT